MHIVYFSKNYFLLGKLDFYLLIFKKKIIYAGTD